MSKTPAELDAEIQDHLRIAEWKKTKQKRHAVEYGSPLYWALAREDRRKKDAATTARKAKPVNVTPLNVFTLGNLVLNHGGHVRFPNAINATDRSGLARCVRGGLVKVEGRDLVLTSSGRAAIGDWIVSELDREARSPAKDDYYRERQALRVHKLEHAAETLGNEHAHARIRFGAK